MDQQLSEDLKVLGCRNLLTQGGFLDGLDPMKKIAEEHVGDATGTGSHGLGQSAEERVGEVLAGTALRDLGSVVTVGMVLDQVHW